MLLLVATKKEKMLTVKVAPELLRDFKIAAELKGATMSALVHMFVAHTVREQKEREPEAFNRKRRGIQPVLNVKIKRPRGKDRDQDTG